MSMVEENSKVEMPVPESEGESTPKKSKGKKNKSSAQNPPPPANEPSTSDNAQPEPLSPEEFEAFIKDCMQAAAERDEWKDRYTRLLAEYDNFRKRTAREKDQVYGDAVQDCVSSFLSVYDNLQRAVAQSSSEDGHDRGIELIFKGFVDVLSKLQVTEIPALGEPFDPALHNAVLHIEDEKLGENTVAEVFQAGFVRDGRVIRHATVKVAN